MKKPGIFFGRFFWGLEITFKKLIIITLVALLVKHAAILEPWVSPLSRLGPASLSHTTFKKKTLGASKTTIISY